MSFENGSTDMAISNKRVREALIPKEFNQPLVIAGSGRSGTTWVLDAVAKINGLRTVFEPLKPEVIPEAESYAYRYVPEDMDVPELKDFMTRVFDGSFQSLWSDYRSRPNNLRPRMHAISSLQNFKVLARNWRTFYYRYRRYRNTLQCPRVIVKFIRANLMLGWIRRVFDARIVFLVRHPGAVVESRLRLGGDEWDPYKLLQRYQEDQTLVAYNSKQYSQLLNWKLSPVQALTAIWCIENQIPLETANRHGYVVVFFERLLAQPDQEWPRLVQGLGLSQTPNKQIITEPSQQASAKWHIGGCHKITHQGWMERLGSAKLDAINTVLQVMGVSAYSAYDPLPSDKYPGSDSKSQARFEDCREPSSGL